MRNRTDELDTDVMLLIVYPSVLPMIFILFYLSCSLQVTFTELHVPFLHFLTNVCAIVGGKIVYLFLFHNELHCESNMNHISASKHKITTFAFHTTFSHYNATKNLVIFRYIHSFRYTRCFHIPQRKSNQEEDGFRQINLKPFHCKTYLWRCLIAEETEHEKGPLFTTPVN